MKWLFIVFSLLIAKSAFAYNENKFNDYLNIVKQKALSENISLNTIDKTFETIRYLPKIVKLDRKQSEFTVTFEKYQENQITKNRIKKATSYLKKFKSTFDNIETKYNVPREMIVALWAIESNFGKNMGGYHVPSSLATLAYDGRRRELFENQLIKALHIIDDGHINPKNMKGSWAGAMGQSQFMPSSFLNYAVDYTKDGTKDIWRAKADVWASIANYLSTEGWINKTPKAVKVILPKGFKASEENEKEYIRLSEYKNIGVKLLENVRGNPMVKLITPDRSINNQSFVVFKNFDVILDWNRSYFFALTVSRLSDIISIKLFSK